MLPSAFIGIDVGTSGCRAIAIDSQENKIASAQISLLSSTGDSLCSEQDPNDHWQAVRTILKQLVQQCLTHQIEAIAVDATSGSILLTDKDGEPLTAVLMYNDARAVVASNEIAAIAPTESGAHGATSGLAKLIYLNDKFKHTAHLLHQADWINYKLGAPLGISDENNALKTGYDPIQRKWPEWIKELVDINLLPQVVEPGSVIGRLSAELTAELSLSTSPKLIAGTTDSIAALLATGAKKPGDAVTSLGSTLVLKLISKQPVFKPEQGIYSHRLGKYWLVGGASNTGGAVLKHFFTAEQLTSLSTQIDFSEQTPDYYPLLTTGERFPFYDLNKQAVMSPRPENDSLFLYGLLTGIANIEAQGYQCLVNAGAQLLHSIRTVGCGAKNSVWQTIRQRHLHTILLPTTHTEAAYGAALLAKGINFNGDNN